MRHTYASSLAIFTLASVPETMKTLMQAYGAAVVACPTSESRWDLMRQGVEGGEVGVGGLGHQAKSLLASQSARVTT